MNVITEIWDIVEDSCFLFTMAIFKVWMCLLVLVTMQGIMKFFVGVTLTIGNESMTVGQKLALHWHTNKGQDFGTETLMPFNHVTWTFTTSFLGNDIYTCTFASPSKPTTTINVFMGFAHKNPTCNCNGISSCFWQALNDNFWSNSNFIQKWGWSITVV